MEFAHEARSSIMSRNASLIARAFGGRAKRRSFLRRMIIALRRSRRRRARHPVGHYRHLIARDFRRQLASMFLNFSEEKASSQDANGDQAAARTHQPTGPDA
jgi:hypothetical protein